MKRLQQAKLIAQALKPSNIARGLHAPTQEEIDAAMARMSPEQRAAYEAQLERARGAQEQAKAIQDESRILEGPAAGIQYGARSKAPPQIEDPAQRAYIAAQERAARDAARAPYRAPNAVPVQISRLATRGKTQLEEVMAHLGGSGLTPDRIFGVYRVPDRISQALTPRSEKGRIVEWDIVHAPATGHSAPLTMTVFPADEQWVAKRVGEPSTIDEDLALAFCAGAGIGPEQCAGLARYCEFRALQDGDEHSSNPVMGIVRGIVAIHTPDRSGTFERMRAGAPLHLGPPQGIHLEALNWAAVAPAVHPKINHPPPVPSPFPYLPATPQELLRAHLEVVGIQPADCYSAQATVNAPRGLVQSGLMTTNVGPKQPCADGEHRMRSHGCRVLLFAYRDRPEYVEGRARWQAYQTEVLQAHLERGIKLWRPVEDPDEYSDLPRFLRPLARTADFVGRFDPDYWFDSDGEQLPPHRYCWPPVR